MVDLEENLYEKAEELLEKYPYCQNCEWYRQEHGEGSCRWDFDLTDQHCPLEALMTELAKRIREIEKDLKDALR